jgi:hypothetical protein
MCRVVLATPWLSIFALGFTSRPCMGALVTVPPVTITQIPVTFAGATGSLLPGPGYLSSGFTAAISAGDIVAVRFQAPPGKKFVVHKPATTQGFFSVGSYWQATADQISHTDPHTVTFWNFQGTPPTETYSYVAISDAGLVVMANKMYSVSGDFEFTAFEIDITASPPLVAVPGTFSDVRSNWAPSFDGSMEIVDMAVPAKNISWGRLKSLYR